MGKRLVHDYEFNADSNKISFNEIITQDRFLLITNVTDGVGMYTFNDPNSGISSASYDYDNTKTTITLEKTTSTMDDSDTLQIFIEDNATEVEFNETYIDPVAKIRVSQPENLIDTDFEYGLQSTKWETLELVKNIPTFFSRNGDLSLAITRITTRANSDAATVFCSDPHGITRGTPILVQGTKSNLANGGFVVTATPDENTFEFKCKGTFSTTSNIFDTYTQIFIASIFQGTEFDLEGISAITTTEGTPSNLIVKTKYPTNFEEGTSFFLTNSFAKSNLIFKGDSTAVDPVNSRVVTKTSGVNGNHDPATSGDVDPWTNRAVATTAWEPVTVDGLNGALGGILFNPEDVTISQGQISTSYWNRITFPEPHGYEYVGVSNRPAIGTFYIPPGAVFGNMASTMTVWIRRYDAYSLELYYRYNYSNGYQYNFGSSSTLTNGEQKCLLVMGVPYYYALTNGQFITHAYSWYPFGTSGTTAIRNALVAAGVERWAMHMYPPGTAFDSYTPYEMQDPRRIDNTGIATVGTERIFYSRNGSINNTVVNWNDWRFGLTTTQALTMTRNRNYDYTPESDFAYNYMHIAPWKRVPTGNSIFIANHGFAGGEIATVTAAAGTLPNGLSNGGTYQVVKINDNRIAFKTTTGTDINFLDAGSADLVVQVSALSINLEGDTIYISDNTFSNGDPIVYTNNGTTDIPGLADGTTYYVFEKTGDKIKLASTQTGLFDSAGVNLVVNQQSSVADPRINTNGTVYSTTNTLNSGDIVKTSQITGASTSGILDGAFYWIDKTGTSITLYPSDSDRQLSQNSVSLARTSTGTFRVQKSSLIDITGYDSGDHSVLANFVGAADGVYSLDNSYESAGSYFFTVSNPGQVLRRTQTINQEQDVDLYYNAIKLENHGYITGNNLVYSISGTPIGGLSNGGQYWIKRVSKDWFRLAIDETQSLDSDNAYITFDSVGSGSAILTGTSIVGETSGVGTLSITQGTNTILGTGTKFTSVFNSGDDFNLYFPEKIHTGSVTWNSAENAFVPADSIEQYVTGYSAIVGGDAAPTGLTLNQRYYLYNVGTRVELMDNPTDAIAGTNPITISSNGTNATISVQNTIGSTFESTINFVNSNTKIILDDTITDSSTDSAGYSVNSKLLVRADGFALHRPYDGGVELIPSTNPDSKMIRQTRKYFRYQSGKGIQVSFAVNFKPTVDIELLNHSDSTGTITTRYPHRINITDSADLLDVVVKNASNGTDYWNGLHRVTNIVDDYTFNIDLGGNPTGENATGIPTYYVNNWRNCALRCGLFDDQNGILFEFDGEDLYVVIRSSTQQISGVASVEFKSGDVRGTGTKFTEQLSVGTDVVIKGQTYAITKISSDTLFHILPSYRGKSADNVIITKTVDRKIAQSEWNLDKCDGTGKTGFKLDLGKIQMAYIDYSWYGAGKVRFGFKNQHGVVRYVHEFVHGNFQTEAYMRSGNLPARYELASSGKPTYVPALAHWGTSVIMDGRFDDDKAYVFTANSLTTTILSAGQADSSGATVIDAPGYINFNDIYAAFVNGQWRTVGYSIELSSTSNQYNSFTNGMAITGSGIPSGTKLQNPQSGDVTPYQPYLPQVYVGRYDNQGRIRGIGYRNLLLIDQRPTSEDVSDNFAITVQEGSATTASATGTNVNRDIPIISIRLAPSVDTNTPGPLGEREIINRMQLILNEVDILTTHGLEVELRVNGQLDNNDWTRVQNPSLSQLIYHGSNDNISGGTTVFSFNAQGSEATTRTAVLTAKSLGDVATLGNSIMGGDATFPDGPDVLTVVGKLKEDPSTVTSTNALTVQGRISWSESQA